MEYDGGESSFIVVLPNTIDGINDVAEKIKDFATSNKAFDDMSIEYVKVFLPKFKIESTIDLIDILESVSFKAKYLCLCLILFLQK